MKKLEKGQKAPIEDWLKTLPDCYRERALSQIDREWRLFRAVVDCLDDATEWFCDWDYTEGGFDFWDAVRDWAHNPDKYTLPPLPQQT